ncbi:hypothetical protein NVP1081O_204 [Vibrio phage 1.081.O._10N.286.52.C2]|nr:hypothetical protein NVP1081O_204 [Vibrio phage 1.081.O._10N.286.52.C2]
MRIVPSKAQTEYTKTQLRAQMTGTLFVCLTEPNENRHYMLASRIGDGGTSIVDLINGTIHSLDDFPGGAVFHKVDGVLTID